MTTLTWSNTNGGYWETGAEWSAAPGPSTAGDDIVINQPGTYAIYEDVAESAASVLVDSPGATLVLFAPLDVAGAFTLDAGTVVFAGASSLTAGSFALNGGVVAGTRVDITATSPIALNGGSIIVDAATLVDPAGTISLPVLGPVQTASSSATASDNWTQSVAFSQFSPSQGTLVGINSSVTASVAGTVRVTSLEGAPSTVTVSLPGSATMTSPTGLGLASASVYAAATGSLAAAGAGASTDSLTLSNSEATQGVYDTSAADLAAFSGTGSVPVSLSGSTGLEVTGPANMQVVSTGSVSATAGLQYGYMPVSLSSDGSAPGDSSWGGDYSGDFFESTVALAAPTLDSSGETPVTTAPQTFTFADQTTGWSSSLAAAQFNPALGSLQSVNITLSGDILASVQAENEGASPGTVSTSQTATVALAVPGSAALTIDPTVTAEMALSAFDGTVDFAGTSGQIDQGLTQSSATSEADYLAAFIGQGTVSVPITDFGTGTIDGPADMAASLLAQSGATVTISYTYLPAPAYTWTNLAGGDWSEGSNWLSADGITYLTGSDTFGSNLSSSVGAPGSGDAAIIASPGSYTVTQTGTATIDSVEMDDPTGTLVVDGNLTTNILTLDAGLLVLNGTLANATVMDNGGSLAIVSAVLDDVAWNAPVNLSAAGAKLSVFNGTTLEPLGGSSQTQILLTGSGSALTFDTETLVDTLVTLGAAGGSVTLSGPTSTPFVTINNGTVTPQPSLVLAASTTLNAVTPDAGLIQLEGNITNQGLINDADGDVALGSFTPPPVDQDGDGVTVTNSYFIPDDVFDNEGTILATAGTGSTFTIGDLTAFTNAGLIRVGNGDELVVQADTFVNTGTIALTSGGTVAFGYNASNIGTIAFTAGAGEKLILNNPSGQITPYLPGTQITASIVNFGTGDTIEFGGGMTVTGASVVDGNTIAVDYDSSAGAAGTYDLTDVSFASSQQISVGVDPLTGDSYVQSGTATPTSLQTEIDNLYSAILRTQPTTAELDQAVGKLGAGQMTLAQFEAGLITGGQPSNPTPPAAAMSDDYYSVTAADQQNIQAGVPGTRMFVDQPADLPVEILVPSTTIVIGSNQLIDPNSESFLIAFLGYAKDDTVVLQPNGFGKISGFDPGSDVLDFSKLFSAANVDLNGNLATLGDYVTITDQGGNALVNFDPSGHGNGSTVVSLQGLGSTVTSLETLVALGAIRVT